MGHTRFFACDGLSSAQERRPCGVVVIVNMMIGQITPPSGMLLHVTNALTGVPINAMPREGWLFLLMMLALLLAMTLWPQIVL
jgi:TRAP-type C4-dicarboxylate transport system permease large subunit